MRFLEVGESMLSPRNEHHFLGAAIGGIFGTLHGIYEVDKLAIVRLYKRLKFSILQNTEKLINRPYRDWETDRKSVV